MLEKLKNIKLQAGLIFLLAILQYANTANHDYAWDDAIVLTENTRVQKGLSDIPDLFRNIKSNETQNRYGYRPVALLSFATDVELFGMNPKAAHKVSILLYGLMCLVVLLFVRMIFPNSPIGALLITALFVVHPLHTEVVANIKSRDEVLALGFGLLSVMSYAKAIEGKGRMWFAVSLILMVLAFLSKESAITLVAIAFAMPWVLGNTSAHIANLKKSLPLLVFLGLLLAIRAIAYSDWVFENNDLDLAQKGLYIEDGYVGNPLSDADFATKIATAFFLLVYFIFRFFLPYPLLHDYSYNQFAVQQFSNPIVWVCVAAVLGLVALTVYGIFKKKPFGIGILLFLTASSIYLHLAQIAPDIFAERFLFVPSLGICVSLLTFLSFPKLKKVMTIGVAAAIIPCFAYTLHRNEAWKDNRTLLETDIPRLENCVRANYNYALYLHNEYYQLPENQRPAAKEEILGYYEQTMAITDRLFNVYIDLGGAYMEFGYPEKALDIFTKASKKYPELSLPWVQLGKYYMSFKQYAKAIPYFKRAMKVGAKNSDYHYLMAICLFNSGWYDEAVETMLEGEKLGVSSSAYHSLIARLYVKLGKKQEAIDALNRGLQLYPQDQGLKNSITQLQQQG